MHKLVLKKIEKPVEINVQISKTIQEKQFEPFNCSVSLKSNILPNEVSSEFTRIHELLEDELSRIMNSRIG